MQGHLVVRITPADVGRRVSVRVRIPATAGQPGTSDTVGRLLAWSDQTLSVQRRSGQIVTIAEADLLAGKVIPEMSPRRKEG